MKGAMKMTDILEKYDNLLNDIRDIKSAANELVDIIGRNNMSIEWHRNNMAEQIEKCPDYDCEYGCKRIEALERQNALIEELEKHVWASHIGKPYGL
jgi:hypothetical protein